ncbi:MAG: hypothetical protein JKX74_09360 [Flavobacteriales bacterium]|nr:hypothetical protein [Flavobacteriales bacterium]
MKTYSTCCVAALLLIATPSLSQTKMIAHLSHSGSPHTFSFTGAGNFGLPAYTLDSIVKLSDTSVVEIGGYRNWAREVDTVINHPYCNNPKISLDSLQQIYGHVKLVGFGESIPKTNTRKKRQILRSKNAPDVYKQNAVSLLFILLLLFMGLFTYISAKVKLKKSTDS